MRGTRKKKIRPIQTELIIKKEVLSDVQMIVDRRGSSTSLLENFI